MPLYNPPSAGGAGGATEELDNLGTTAVNANINPGVTDTIKLGASPSNRFAEINVAYGAFPYLDITSQDGADYFGSIGIGSSDATVSTALESYEALGVGRTYGAGLFSVKNVKINANGHVMYMGNSETLLDTFWGGDVPGLIIDGESTRATSAGAAGIIYKGTDSAPFILATQDRVDGDSTASFYFATGSSTIIPGRTGDYDFSTGSTNDAVSQSGNFIVATGGNASGTTGFARIKSGNGATSGNIILETGTGSTLRGSIELNGLNTQITNPLILLNQTTLEFREGTGGGTHAVKLRAPATLAADYTLTFPADDGDADQVLKTNGSGTLSWTTPAAAGANTTLSNLGTTAINSTLLPSGAVNLGAFNNPWGSTYIQGLFMYEGTTKRIEFQVTGQTSPSGAKTSPTVDSATVGYPLTFFTHTATGSNNSGELNIETGNTATGTSGNINLRAGVPSGAGTSGKVVATGQGLQLVATGTKPAAAVGVRGTMFYTPGGAGVADTFELCAKDAADAYAWVTLI